MRWVVKPKVDFRSLPSRWWWKSNSSTDENVMAELVEHGEIPIYRGLRPIGFLLTSEQPDIIISYFVLYMKGYCAGLKDV